MLVGLPDDGEVCERPPYPTLVMLLLAMRTDPSRRFTMRLTFNTLSIDQVLTKAMNECEAAKCWTRSVSLEQMCQTFLTLPDHNVYIAINEMVLNGVLQYIRADYGHSTSIHGGSTSAEPKGKTSARNSMQ